MGGPEVELSITWREDLVFLVFVKADRGGREKSLSRSLVGTYRWVVLACYCRFLPAAQSR